MLLKVKPRILVLVATTLAGGVATGTPTLASFKSFDAQVDHGTLQIRTDRVIISPGGRRSTSETSTCAYRNDGWSISSLAVDPSGQRHREDSTYVRGQAIDADYGTRTIIVTSGQPKREKSAETVGLILGPSLPLGRGLSRLNGLEEKLNVLEGTANDTGHLEAHLSGTAPRLPTEIRRVLPHGYIVTWTYRGWRLTHGVWMPTSVESAPNKGELQVLARYSIKDFDPRTPPDGEIEPKLVRPGFKLLDQRVEPQQAYGEAELRRIANGDKLSVEALLAVSKERAATMRATFAKGAQVAEAAERRRSHSGAVAFAGVGLGVMGILGLVFARRLVKQS